VGPRMSFPSVFESLFFPVLAKLIPPFRCTFVQLVFKGAHFFSFFTLVERVTRSLPFFWCRFWWDVL